MRTASRYFIRAAETLVYLLLVVGVLTRLKSEELMVTAALIGLAFVALRRSSARQASGLLLIMADLHRSLDELRMHEGLRASVPDPKDVMAALRSTQTKLAIDNVGLGLMAAVFLYALYSALP